MVASQLIRLQILLDGDNTLWDTNAVFARAQRALLRELALHGWRVGRLSLARLREVDGCLASRLNRKEYDFRVLARALMYDAEGRAPGEALSSAVSGKRNAGEEDIIRRGVEKMEVELRRIPPLLPGARALLAWIRAQRGKGIVYAVLISEGDRRRLQRIVEHHLGDHGSWFDEVHILPSKEETIRRLVEGAGSRFGGRVKSLMVGDSLNGDIEPAAKAGAITVYKPAEFLGKEELAVGWGPTYTVESLVEALGILNSVLQDCTWTEAHGSAGSEHGSGVRTLD